MLLSCLQQLILTKISPQLRNHNRQKDKAPNQVQILQLEPQMKSMETRQKLGLFDLLLQLLGIVDNQKSVLEEERTSDSKITIKGVKRIIRSSHLIPNINSVSISPGTNKEANILST